MWVAATNVLLQERGCRIVELWVDFYCEIFLGIVRWRKCRYKCSRQSIKVPISIFSYSPDIACWRMRQYGNEVMWQCGEYGIVAMWCSVTSLTMPARVMAQDIGVADMLHLQNALTEWYIFGILL